MPNGTGKHNLVRERNSRSPRYPPVIVHRYDESQDDLDLDADNELSDSDSDVQHGIDNAAYCHDTESNVRSSSRMPQTVEGDIMDNEEQTDNDQYRGHDLTHRGQGQDHQGYMQLEGQGDGNARMAVVALNTQPSSTTDRTTSQVRQVNGEVQRSNVIPSRRGWNHKFARISSVLHLLCAVLSFTFGLLLLGLPGIQTSYSKAGHGMWSGAIFSITGAIGLKAAHIKSPGSITALLIMCTLSGICCFIIVFLEVYTLTKIEEFYQQYEPGRTTQTATSRHNGTKLQVPSHWLVTMHVLLILTAIVEFTVAVWLFILAATALCCPVSAIRDVSIIYAPNV